MAARDAGVTDLLAKHAFGQGDSISAHQRGRQPAYRSSRRKLAQTRLRSLTFSDHSIRNIGAKYHFAFQSGARPTLSGETPLTMHRGALPLSRKGRALLTRTLQRPPSFGGRQPRRPRGHRAGTQVLRSGLDWRLLVEDDDNVDIYIVRDADSVMNIKERVAVADWLKTRRAFHVMRADLRILNSPAGMWGAHRGNIGDMRAGRPTARSCRQIANYVHRDQHFLRQEALFRAAHDIKGEAATFGYPAVASAAEEPLPAHRARAGSRGREIPCSALDRPARRSLCARFTANTDIPTRRSLLPH